MLKYSIALLLFLTVQAPEYVLDLVGQPRSTDEEYLAVPPAERADERSVVVITSDQLPAPQIPFVIEQMQFDRSSYDMGADFFVEVSIRYVGSDPVLFPNSLQPHLFRRTMPGFRVAAMGVAFEHPAYGHQVQLAERLYGADEIAGSLVQIAPNQLIRIRAEGSWGLPSQRSVGIVNWPLTITPKVTFDLYGTTYTHRPVSLASGTEIVLSRKQ